MKPQIRVNDSNVGIEVYVRNPDISNLESTYLTADAAASASSFTVQRGTGFVASGYAVVDYLNENAEVLLVGSVTATTLASLSPSTSYAHPQDTKVSFIPYNQVEIYTSSDNVTFALLTTISIQPDKTETIHLHTAGTAATYYKARFKNSTDTSYSAYTDSVIGSGYADGTVYSIKKRALGATNEVIGETITDEFLNEALWQARRFVHNSRKRWSFRQEFDYSLGALSAGVYSVTTPTNLQDRNTNKNILSLRIGTDRNLEYMTKAEWDTQYINIGHTTVATQPVVGATTLVLTDTSDLDDSGSIDVFTSGTINNITYTAKNDTTNTLSGIPSSSTGSITATHAAGTDVWQGASFGMPTHYTVFEGTIYFDTPLSASEHGWNGWMDYYKTITAYDSDSDTFDEPEYDLYVYYLIYRIRKKRNQGVSGNAEDDPDYKEFIRGLSNMIRNEVLGQKIRLIPATNHLR